MPINTLCNFGSDLWSNQVSITKQGSKKQYSIIQEQIQSCVTG